VNGVWGSSASNVFAVGGALYGDGTILHYNGTAWSAMECGTTNWLSAVWGSSATDVYAVGYGGTILHYNGSSWTPMTSGTTNGLYAVWGSSATDVYAVGDGGTILHYNGSSWTLMTSGTTNGLHGVWGSSATDVFIVGGGGTILHYGATVPSTSTTTTSVAPTTTTTSCPAPDLNAPVGTTMPIPDFSWTQADSGAWYNVLVYSETKNAIANSMWVGPGNCDPLTHICTAKFGTGLTLGNNWWWLNVYYGDPACGYVIQPGGKVKAITVVGCTAVPSLTSPAGTRAPGQSFVFQGNGSDWYQLMVYTSGLGITINLWEDSAVCTGGTCSITPSTTIPYGSTNWWWLNTYSASCGYKVQPGGLVNSFFQQ
jgi:hypothetical protein